MAFIASPVAAQGPRSGYKLTLHLSAVKPTRSDTRRSCRMAASPTSALGDSCPTGWSATSHGPALRREARLDRPPGCFGKPELKAKLFLIVETAAARYKTAAGEPERHFNRCHGLRDRRARAAAAALTW